MVTELEKKIMGSANLNHMSKDKEWFSGPYQFEAKGCEIQVVAYGEGVVNEWGASQICYNITGIEVKIFGDEDYSKVWLERDGESEVCSDFDIKTLTDDERHRLEAWCEIMYHDDFEATINKLVRWFGVDRLFSEHMISEKDEISGKGEWHTEPVRFFADGYKAEYAVAAFGKFDEGKAVLDEIEVMVLTHHANTAVLFDAYGDMIDADGDMKHGDFKPEKNVIRVLEGGGCETYPADDEDKEALKLAIEELSHGDDFDVLAMRNYITFICSVYGTYGKY